METDEKKKRLDDDEDNRYDYNPIGGKVRAPGGLKTTTRSLLKGNTMGGPLPAKGTVLRKVPTSAVGEKSGGSSTLTKRKTITGNSKR